MITARPATISTLGLKVEAAPVNNGAGEVLTGETLPGGGGTTALLETAGAGLVGAGAGTVAGEPGAVGAGAPGVTT